MESETCSFCNEPDPLLEPNGANLEPVVRLSCLHSFHLRCMIISLKKDTTCPRCQQLIYLGDDDDAKLNPQKEDNVKKFFKELSNKPQDFNPLPVVLDVETGDLTATEMVFVKLHNKILHAERILKEKTREVSRAEYEILDSHYPLGEALEKKLAEFTSIHPPQTARTLLNAEIRRQFPSDMTRNIFNKKKRSAKNIYNIFKIEGLGRDQIKRIKRISPSYFGKFTDKEIKIIQERIKTNYSRLDWLENQYEDLDLEYEREAMLTD